MFRSSIKKLHAGYSSELLQVGHIHSPTKICSKFAPAVTDQAAQSGPKTRLDNEAGELPAGGELQDLAVSSTPPAGAPRFCRTNPIRLRAFSPKLSAVGAGARAAHIRS
jgi:hypothetical protein